MGCFDKFKDTELHGLLKKRTGFDDASTPEGKEAYLKSAKELQGELLSKTHDVYSKVGVKGYEKNVVEEKPIETPAAKEEITPQETTTETVRGGDFTKEGGNKLVDESGKPLTLYHASKNEISGEIFESEKGDSGAGIYFSPSKDYGENNARKGYAVNERQVAMKNPYVYEIGSGSLRYDLQQQGVELNTGKDVQNYLKEKGHDGIIRTVDGKPEEIVAFDKSQIKQTTTETVPKEKQVVEINDWDLPTDELSRNAAYIPIKAAMLNGDIVAIGKDGEEMGIKSPSHTLTKTHVYQYNPDIDYFKAKTDKGRQILSQLNAEHVARETSKTETVPKEEQTPATEKPTIEEPPSIPPKTTVPISEGEGESKTGIKNSVSANIRQTYNLPKVELPKLGTDTERLHEGKRLVDSGEVNPTDVIDKIKDGKGKIGMQPDEAKAMLYYTHQLHTHYDQLQEVRSQAETPEEKLQATGQIQQLSDLMDAATEANMLAGTPWSDVGQTRQINVDQGFNPSRDKAIIKDAYGGEIPKDVQAKLDVATKERDDAISKAKDLEEQLKQKEAELQIAQMKKGRAKGGNFKEKRASLIEDLKAAKKEQEDWLKEQGIQKMGVGGFTLTGKMVKIIGQLAKTYIDEGAEKLEDIVSKIHGEVSKFLDGISKKDIRDAIALHEAEKLETKAKGLEGNIENDNIPPDINKLKLKFQKDEKWVKANQQVYNAEHKIRKIKSEAFQSQKNMLQKAMMWGSKLVRGSVLSGVNVLYKLASAAAIGGVAKRIPEQAVVPLWRAMYKGIANKAPIEGNLNIKAEMKFYKEFFNPAKFVKNTWEIGKTHSSLLGKKMGDNYYDDMAGITMPGKQKTLAGKATKIGLNVVDRVLTLPLDIHQMIKDPVKRATFEASLENGLSWAQKNGMNINDPLIRNVAEVAAYKRANYEIFQEKRWLSKKFNEWKNDLEKKGTGGSAAKLLADFMVPVSTVPTNIVARVLSTSPLGLIRGNVKAIAAYRKGIESLSSEQADAIMRQLKQGSLGTALGLLGWFGAAHFGGLYSKYDPNKKRKEGELTSDQMEVNGEMIPKPVQHALPLEVIQTWATARHVYDNYTKNKGASVPEAAFQAGMASTGALLHQVPIVSTGAEAAGALNDPYEAKKFKEDMQRRFEPQILKETGVIGNKGDKLEQLKDKYTDSDNIFKNDLERSVGKPISTDQFKDYKDKRDGKITKYIDNLYSNGINGKTFDQMSEKEQSDEVTYLKTKATNEIKQELFGKKIETHNEKIADKKLHEERKKLYQ